MRRMVSVVAAGCVVLAAAAANAPAAGPRYAVGCSPVARVTVAGAAVDLTGKWGTTQGTYYIRQLGTCVWWSGSSASGASWAHVFFGQISGATVSGVWADVPSATIRQAGTLKLRIGTGGATLTRLAQTGNFGDAEWTRSG